MKLLERLSGWLKPDPSTTLSPELEDLRETIERGRRLKRKEKYYEALAAFDQAALLAQTLHDTGAGVAIALHRADVLTRIGRFAETRVLLGDLDRTAREAHQRNHLAYIHCAFGSLAQAEGDWEAAQTAYETALRFAQEAGSPGAEGRAQGHLADTYLHDGNASYGAHLLREALPKLNTGGDIELSSYFVGRLGEALIITGQEVEGRNLLGRALRLADHMDYITHQRLWQIALAGQAMVIGQHTDAQRLYMMALDITDTSQPTWEAVSLLTRTSRCYLKMAEASQALTYAMRAMALCDAAAQTETDDTFILAQGALGAALRASGSAAEALPYLATAVQHYPRLPLTTADYSLIDLLRYQAATQAETGALSIAFDTYQQALMRASKSDVRLNSAAIHRDIGILYARQNQLQDAIRSWTIALDIYESEHQHGQAARLYSDLGSLRKALGFGRRALQDYERALTMLSSVEDPDTRGLVLANAATIYVDYGDIQTAESFFVEGIKFAQQAGDRASEATRRGNYGWFLLTTGRAQRAITTLEYALRQSQDLGLKLPQAIQTDNLGLAYDELGQAETALTYHHQAHALLADLNAGRWTSIVGANLGHTLVSLDRLTEARAAFEQALASARALDDAEAVARILNGQGRILLKQDDLATADAVLNEAIAQARRAGGRRIQADSLTLRSEFLARSGHIAESAAAWDEAKKFYTLLSVPLAQVTPVWLR